MSSLKGNIGGVILCLLEILAGVLLLVNPVAFTAGIITAAGVVLLVIGVISVLKYFRSDAVTAATGQYLLKGLIYLLAGAFCIFNTNWFIATFPVITIIYGIVILIAGLGKIQITADMIRAKNKKWGFGLISAALSIICAFVILGNPFASVGVLWMFTGTALIAEAIVDIVTMIVRGSKPVR